MLEKNLGLNMDQKRKKRYFSRIEEEGLGLGMFDFLDDIDRKAKAGMEAYEQPGEEYKFNNPEFEVALGASDFEDGDNEGPVDPRDDDSDSDSDSNEKQMGFSDDYDQEVESYDEE